MQPSSEVSGRTHLFAPEIPVFREDQAGKPTTGAKSRALFLKGGVMLGVRKVDFQKIERLRLNLEKEKTRFCIEAGVSVTTYNNLKDAAKVRDDVIIKIATALKVKPSEIVFWEGG